MDLIPESGVFGLGDPDVTFAASIEAGPLVMGAAKLSRTARLNTVAEI